MHPRHGLRILHGVQVDAGVLRIDRHRDRLGREQVALGGFGLGEGVLTPGQVADLELAGDVVLIVQAVVHDRGGGPIGTHQRPLRASKQRGRIFRIGLRPRQATRSTRVLDISEAHMLVLCVDDKSVGLVAEIVADGGLDLREGVAAGGKVVDEDCPDSRICIVGTVVDHGQGASTLEGKAPLRTIQGLPLCINLGPRNRARLNRQLGRDGGHGRQ